MEGANRAGQQRGRRGKRQNSGVAGVQELQNSGRKALFAGASLNPFRANYVAPHSATPATSSSSNYLHQELAQNKLRFELSGDELNVRFQTSFEALD
jgi:hypothetical protein